jgi:hypothetical protein
MSNWQYPANWDTPRRGRWRRALSNNALVAGVVSAVVAGVITVLITHYQDQDSATQQHDAGQAAAIIQLETAAIDFDRATITLFASCSPHPDVCPEPPSSYYSTETMFDVDRANVADPTADRLAVQMENYANDGIVMESTTGSSAIYSMVTTYQHLIARCAQLIQGQA